MNRWVALSLFLRVIITYGLLFPLGFFMGMPFPYGIKLLNKHKMEKVVPIMWGINGIMSIAGSTLAVIISMKLGFSYALAVGGVVYLLLFFKMPLYEKQNDEK